VIDPLGFGAATRVLDLGRAAFFEGEDADLPVSRSDLVAADDRLPQFGYVGKNFAKCRVLFLSINPGNGPRDRRDEGDAIALPALKRFVDERTAYSFLAAQQRYNEVCLGWPIWATHCAKLLAAARLTPDDVAYSYCLPWRTRSEARFRRATGDAAVRLYAMPLLDELKPRVLVALGKRVARILAAANVSHPRLVVWNRERAPRPEVRAEREYALSQIREWTQPCEGAASE
jgi:hypothetical protein